MDWQNTPRRVEKQEPAEPAQFDAVPSSLSSDPKTPELSDAQRKALHSTSRASPRLGGHDHLLARLVPVAAPLRRRARRARARLRLLAALLDRRLHVGVDAHTKPRGLHAKGLSALRSAVSVSFVVEYFLGVFSTPLVVILGMSFYGTGRDRKHALGICLYAIVGYFIPTARRRASSRTRE